MNSRHQISYLGANLELGQQKPGTTDAYGWLKLKGLQESLESQFKEVHDLGQVDQILHLEDDKFFKQYFPYKAHHFPSIAAFNKQLCERVEEGLRNDNLVMSVGGDHALAMGSISGALRVNPDTKVIWVDAHGDFNTPLTSPSGNVHGMPLSFLTGYYEHPITSEYLSWMGKLNPKNIVMIGLRDIDEGEDQILKDLGILWFSSEDVNRLGIEEIMSNTFHYLKLDEESDLHLSFDVDAIDPEFVPSTGTAVQKGMNVEDGEYIISQCFRTGLLKTMDLVEVNPHLGSAEDLKKTQESVFRLLSSFDTEFIEVESQLLTSDIQSLLEE